MQNEKCCERIRQARIAHKMTQKEEADFLGKTVCAVNRWEKGLAVPEEEDIKRLSERFGVSTEWLTGRTDDPAPEECWAKSYETRAVKKEDLPRFRGEPVWVWHDDKAVWALVSETEDELLLANGEKIPFCMVDGLILRNPSPLCYGMDAMTRPLSRSQLLKTDRVWAEEIGPDPASRRRGWYIPSPGRTCFESEYGERFYFRDYGVKWVAFKDFC